MLNFESSKSCLIEGDLKRNGIRILLRKVRVEKIVKKYIELAMIVKKIDCSFEFALIGQVKLVELFQLIISLRN